MHVNLGSLRNESIEKLADEGLLTGLEDKHESMATGERVIDHTTTSEGRVIRGVSWFEEMIEGSELGRIERQRGGQSSADGKSKVEWEVVEFTNESGDSGSSTGKRKLDQVGNKGDTEMRE